MWRTLVFQSWGHWSFQISWPIIYKETHPQSKFDLVIVWLQWFLCLLLFSRGHLHACIFFKKPFLASQHANYCPALNLVSQNKCPENVYIHRAFSISVSMFFVNTNYLTLFCESHFSVSTEGFWSPGLVYLSACGDSYRWFLRDRDSLGPGNIAIPCCQHLVLQTGRDAHTCAHTHTRILMHTASSHGSVTLRISDESNSPSPLDSSECSEITWLAFSDETFSPLSPFFFTFFFFFFFLWSKTFWNLRIAFLMSYRITIYTFDSVSV